MRFSIISIFATLAFTPAVSAQEFVFVPEGSTITCTLEEGCNEDGRAGLSFDLHGQIDAQPLLLQAARGMLLERAQQALNAVRGLSPQQLLSEEVARAVVRDQRWGTLRGLTWAAREEVFTTYQCDIFAHHPDPDNTCWSARAFERSDAEHRGVPVEIMPAIRSMRTELYDLGRMHLMQPDNLQSTYERVRPAMIDEFSQLFYNEQQTFLSVINGGIVVAERLYEPTVVELVETYLVAEAAWRRNSELPESLRSQNGPDHFGLMQAADVALSAEIDSAWALFFNRRHAEGGPTLVNTYHEIMTDFFTAVGAERTSAPTAAD